MILDEIYTWGKRKHHSYFWKCQKYLKTLKTNHLAGFGAPGVLKSDPACIFHHN